MDVLIKGMEMPIGCGWRTENAYGFAKCPFYERCLEKGMRLTRESRPKDCPLVELPPHGDLIERSPLVQKIKDEWQKIHEETGYDVKGIFWNKLVEIIESSEVVLEAST